MLLVLQQIRSLLLTPCNTHTLFSIVGADNCNIDECWSQGRHSGDRYQLLIGQGNRSLPASPAHLQGLKPSLAAKALHMGADLTSLFLFSKHFDRDQSTQSMAGLLGAGEGRRVSCQAPLTPLTLSQACIEGYNYNNIIIVLLTSSFPPPLLGP